MEPRPVLAAMVAVTFGYFVAAVIVAGAVVTIVRLFGGWRP